MYEQALKPAFSVLKILLAAWRGKLF